MRVQKLIKLCSVASLMINMAQAMDYVVKFPGNTNQKSPFYTVDHVTFSVHNISIQDELETAFKLDFKELSVEETWQCNNWLSPLKKEFSKEGYDLYQVESKILDRNHYKKEYEKKDKGGELRDVGLCRATFIKRSHLESAEMIIREALVNKLQKACIRGENGRSSAIHANYMASWPFLRIDSEGIEVTPLSHNSFSSSTDFMAFARVNIDGVTEKMIFPVKILKARHLLNSEEAKQRDLDNARLEYDILIDSAKIVLTYKEPEERRNIFSRVKRYITGEVDPSKEIELLIEACH